MFALDSVVVPVPACVTAPKLLMLFATASALLRLNTRVAMSVTAPVPSVPVAPPLPICSVPSLRVVMPELRFAPVKISVPLPSLVRAPVVAVLAPLIVRLVAAVVTSIELVVPAVSV